MIKFALAALAATFTVHAHAAELTTAETCGHLENHSRFNPTELSEYQECWLGLHGEEAGVLGSLFYAKVGDSFVSMPVKVIREAGSKSAAKAVVVEKIVEKATALTEEQESAIDLFESLKESGITATAANSAVVAATGVDILAMAKAAASANAPAYGYDINGRAHEAAADKVGLPAEGENITNLVKYSTPGSFDNPRRVYYSVDVNGFAIFSNQFAATHHAIDDILEKVYDRGYSEGYDRGYADGYADGFDAGVASVQ